MGVRATGGGGPVTPVSAVNFLLCGGGEAPELTVERPRLSHVWPRLRGGLCLWVRHAALWQGRVHRVAHGAVHVVRSGGKIRSPYLPPTPYTPPPSLPLRRVDPAQKKKDIKNLVGHCSGSLWPSKYYRSFFSRKSQSHRSDYAFVMNG